MIVRKCKWALGCQPVGELLYQIAWKWWNVSKGDMRRHTDKQCGLFRSACLSFSGTRGRAHTAPQQQMLVRSARPCSPLWCARPHLYTTIITNDLSYNLLSKLSFSSQLKDRTPGECEHHKALHFVTNDTLLHKCYKLSPVNGSRILVASEHLSNLKYVSRTPHTASSTFRGSLFQKIHQNRQCYDLDRCS